MAGIVLLIHTLMQLVIPLMVFMGDLLYVETASHFKGLYWEIEVS